MIGLALWIALHAPPALLLRVTPSAAFAPQDLFLQVRVQPIPSDRVLSVETDSEDFARVSRWTLDGDEGPHLYSWTWPGVPAGAYTIVAGIGDGTRWRARDAALVTILPR